MLLNERKRVNKASKFGALKLCPYATLWVFYGFKSVLTRLWGPLTLGAHHNRSALQRLSKRSLRLFQGSPSQMAQPTSWALRSRLKERRYFFVIIVSLGEIIKTLSGSNVPPPKSLLWIPFSQKDRLRYTEESSREGLLSARCGSSTLIPEPKDVKITSCMEEALLSNTDMKQLSSYVSCGISGSREMTFYIMELGSNTAVKLL